MLSEALQRNAEYEARLSNISVYFRWWIGPDLIRDGKAGLAPKAFGAALQLRFAQNDTMRRVLIHFAVNRVETLLLSGCTARSADIALKSY